jgi:hypothetical protein
MSYLDEIYNDEVYTGPHTMDSYFAEEYDTTYDTHQKKPTQPPRGFINYETIRSPPRDESDNDESESESKRERITRKKTLGNNLSGQRSARKKGRKNKLGKSREFFGTGTGDNEPGLRMLDIFILVLICILMMMQIKMNWALNVMSNPPRRVRYQVASVDLHNRGLHPEEV